MVTEKVSLRGKVIWFFGISGSGKTTLADMLAKELLLQGHKVERLDGDIIRSALCKDLGFTRKDIYENIRRVSYVADILSRNGITVIASFITPHITNRIFLKTLLGDRLILIHVMCSLTECMKRDPKGLWSLALHGNITNFAGWDAPFETVKHSIVDVSTISKTEEESYKKILYVLRFLGFEV